MLPTLPIPQSRVQGGGGPVTDTEGEAIQRAVGHAIGLYGSVLEGLGVGSRSANLLTRFNVHPSKGTVWSPHFSRLAIPAQSSMEYEIGTSRRSNTEVRLTHRWRKMDSNHRSGRERDGRGGGARGRPSSSRETT